MAETLETSLPLDALRMAPGRRLPTNGLVRHPDRGCQYAGEAYPEHLAAWQVTPSMSRRGHCYDNAAMESFWSTLKEELVHGRSFVSRTEAAGAIFDHIESFCNRERLYRAPGYLSPVKFEKQSGEFAQGRTRGSTLLADMADQPGQQLGELAVNTILLAVG